MRILVIDDDYTCRVQTKALLGDLGDCDGASTGTIGLELFKLAHAESCPYQLVVLDIDMPGMDGLEVLSQLRQWEEQNDKFQEGRAAKVMMLSALDDGRTVFSSFSTGCEMYFVKPLSPAKLADALKNAGLQ
jgi:CheY-like chemotaxis protein